MARLRAVFFFAVCLSLSACKSADTQGSTHAAPASSSVPQGPTPTVTRNIATEPKVGSGEDKLGILLLEDGSKFKTTLYGLKVLGSLTAEKKKPFYIMSGTGCDDCDADTSIYVHSPSDGPMEGEGEQERFAYPGREKDIENEQPDYEGRMFFGDCIKGHPNALVSFDRFRNDDGTWGSAVTLVEVKADRLTVSQLHENLPEIGETQNQVQKKQCNEIPGVDRFSEP